MLLFRKKETSPEIDVVLSASGARAPCFIGAVEAILKKGYTIKRIAGSSGGSIIAASYALGMNTGQMKEMLPNAPFSVLKDFKVRNLLSLKNPSVFTGKELDKFFKELYGDAKMGDCQIDCRISTVTILGRKRKLITPETYPDLPVWKAVRMSSTIPFIFPYYELEGMPITDGALITEIHDIFPESERLIVSIRPRADYNIKKTVQDVRAKKLFVWHYLKVLAEYMVDAVDNHHIPDQEWSRTIIIPTREIGGFNFNLDSPEIERLVQAGYDSVMDSNILPFPK